MGLYKPACPRIYVRGLFIGVGGPCKRNPVTRGCPSYRGAKGKDNALHVLNEGDQR